MNPARVIIGKSRYDILAQLNNNPAHVWRRFTVFTLFGLAAQNGTLGLLCQGWDIPRSAGSAVAALKIGDVARVQFDDGTARAFRITRIERFTAQTPLSPYSNFVDAAGKVLTSTELFQRTYGNARGGIVFQTCERGETVRLFVTGEEVKSAK